MLKNYSKIREKSINEMKNDSYYGQILSHPIATVLVSLIENTRITPNFITFLSLLFTLLGGFVVLLLEGQQGLLLGWGIWHIAVILDSADGQLARWKNLSSDFGGYFDGIVDHIKHRAIIVVIAIRMSVTEEYALLLGMIAIAMHSLAFYEGQSRIISEQKNKGLINKKKNVTNKIFGTSTFRKILAFLQVELHAYFLFMIIFFIMNKPMYLLYFIVANSTFIFLKRFTIFFLTTRKEQIVK